MVTMSGIALSAKATGRNPQQSSLINFATSRKGQEMIREMHRIPQAHTDVKPLARNGTKQIEVESGSQKDVHRTGQSHTQVSQNLGILI